MRPVFRQPPQPPAARTKTVLVLRHTLIKSGCQVETQRSADTRLRAARGVDRKLVTEIRLFDVYEGASLAEGKKSLAIAVVLQPQERTLIDAEIEGFSKRLIAQVE
jgi:phenylalanyl-tRNA synthetase beta subunit